MACAQVALESDDVVIRGGRELSLESLAQAFQAHCDRRVAKGLTPEFCLSVNAVPDMQFEPLAKHAKRPNPYLRRSTVGAIQGAGFMIEETPNRRGVDGHCDVFLASGRANAPSEQQLNALRAAFEPTPIPNPAAR